MFILALTIQVILPQKSNYSNFMLKTTLKKIILSSLFCVGIMSSAIAQTDTTKKQNKDEEEEGAADPAGGGTDLSQFQGEMQESTGTKRYCTSKIFGISPTKLISIGYDYQLGYKMTTRDVVDADNTKDEKTENVSRTHGLRFLANFPVVSNNKITVNIGASYMESHYAFDDKNKASANKLSNSLQNNALRSTAINFTIFKPLNIKNFLLINTQHEVNGDYDLTEWQPLKYMKHSATLAYGWKKSDRLQYGFGVARTYRVGEVNYIPVILYNFTAENRKWGIEALFPARVHYRRTFNPRSILLLGYELEGNSYRLQNRQQEFGATKQDVELRRSELRMRAVYERQLSGFIWMSVQAGLRYNARFNVDNGEFFRGLFGDQLYLMKNTLTNPLYFNVSINLVSP